MKKRIASLDIFRGITIALMILVNHPGSWSATFPMLKHGWNGCTLADLVFPFFLFISGTSVVLALNTAKQQTENKSGLMLKIVKRGLLLFVIGLLLNGFPHYEIETLRIMGVLQRIAIVYTITAILFLRLDIKYLLKLGAIILFFYGIAELRLKENGIFELAQSIDTSLLGSHIYVHTKTYDPEGFLSTLTALVSALLGMILGQQIIEKKLQNNLNSTFAWGTELLVAGLVYSTFSPMNKSLWTVSYTLYTGGIAFLLFGWIYYLTDLDEQSRYQGGFFKIFGLNAIGVYVFSQVVEQVFYLIHIDTQTHLKKYIFLTFFDSWLPEFYASLGYALFYVLFCWLFTWALYTRKIIIKL